MILKHFDKKHIICNGCGLTIWNNDATKSATKVRSEYKSDGWRLIVGDGYIYGDYCKSCIGKNRHKKYKKR